MAIKNKVSMSFLSLSENVGIARLAAASFAAQLDFTINEIEEIKVAISEAVSNSVIHGYGEIVGNIDFNMILYDNKIEYTIIDYGRGIENIELARQPAYSTDPERMGLGFVFMESFMDELEIKSEYGQGTTVRMCKKIEIKQEH